MARILLNGEFRDEPTAASIAKRFSAMAHSRREFFMAAYRDETFRPGSGWCRSNNREQGQLGSISKQGDGADGPRRRDGHHKMSGFDCPVCNIPRLSNPAI
jgi:hypothetical protein